MKYKTTNFLLISIFIYSFQFVHAQNIKYPFQDPKLDVESRAKDLLKRLSLEEKVAQMQDVAPAIDRLEIAEYNWWNESLHGVARAGAATSYPQAIGMAATWNPDLIFKVADAISSEARAKFNHSIKLGQRKRYQGLTMWSPNINIFRDPRWGRGQETYGEDPYLVGNMGIATITGLQSDDFTGNTNVIACAKHLIAGSSSINGLNASPTDVSKRTLFAAAIRSIDNQGTSDHVLFVRLSHLF